jgi:hypothetical protein
VLGSTRGSSSVVRIGVMNDMSGPFSEVTGRAVWSPRRWRRMISAARCAAPGSK